MLSPHHPTPFALTNGNRKPSLPAGSSVAASRREPLRGSFQRFAALPSMGAARLDHREPLLPCWLFGWNRAPVPPPWAGAVVLHRSMSPPTTGRQHNSRSCWAIFFAASRQQTALSTKLLNSVDRGRIPICRAVYGHRPERREQQRAERGTFQPQSSARSMSRGLAAGAAVSRNGGLKGGVHIRESGRPAPTASSVSVTPGPKVRLHERHLQVSVPSTGRIIRQTGSADQTGISRSGGMPAGRPVSRPCGAAVEPSPAWAPR